MILFFSSSDEKLDFEVIAFTISLSYCQQFHRYLFLEFTDSSDCEDSPKSFAVASFQLGGSSCCLNMSFSSSLRSPVAVRVLTNSGNPLYRRVPLDILSKSI